MSNLKTSWLLGVDPKDKEETIKTILRGLQSPVIIKLAQIIKTKMVKQVPDYDNSAWPYLQAHYNGRNEALQEILELIKKDN